MLTLFLGLALAQSSVEDLRVHSVTDAIDHALKERGYLKLAHLGQRTHYVPLKIWKPRVMIHDEGFARIRGTTIYPMAIVPIAGGAQVRFVTQNPATVRNQEADVAKVLMPLLSELQEANHLRHEATRAREEASPPTTRPMTPL